MKRVVGRWALVMAVAACAGMSIEMSVVDTRADTPPAAVDQATVVSQFKTDALKALLDGQVKETDQILGKGIAQTDDPILDKMAKWTKAFQGEQNRFDDDRRKEFDKEVKEVRLLIDHKRPDDAIDIAKEAYVRADDPIAFRKEPWVDALVKQAIDNAQQDDQKGQWVESMRIYSDLGALEPSSALWKDKLKDSTRRVRLLSMYAPDTLHKIQVAQLKDVREVRKLLDSLENNKPTTEPTTKPADDDADSDTFKIDWRDTLHGIHMDMLREALVYAREEYYREVPTRDVTIGGLMDLRDVLTTPGLEAAFPNLKNDADRNTLLKTVDEQIEANKNAKTDDDQQQAQSDALTKITDVNNDTVKLPEQVLVNEFADGAFAVLDPFSVMIWPSDVEDFNKQTQGHFSGVGIQIENDAQGNLKVESPLEDSPAFKAGIHAGDIIAQIDGKSAKGISLTQAVKRITGTIGTDVVLTIQTPDGKSHDVTLTRQTIHVGSVRGWIHKPGGGWDYMIDPKQKIAYMRITSFTADTLSELDTAIDSASRAGAKGIIIDLRYNPGGLLKAAFEVCDRFIDKGVIVSTHPDRKTTNDEQVLNADNAEDKIDLPLVVLVNQYSASASEIVSGALKDHHRALLVGQRTFGKGSVQQMYFVTDHTAVLKLTTAHYYLPNGRCIHREENSTTWGVDPDLVVNVSPEQMRQALNDRQDQDVLRDAPANGGDADPAPATQPTTQPQGPDNLLNNDPQLTAGVLLLRFELNGAQL